ncbi:NUDIX hydrolase [Streptomyces zagrosensis]|uniref:8-oxo-dGTP pyrophosphatase MutT (NUDIX family) n=1 Tax=Streptomyces zagrosensis TaxID=1042984 RepID=A0A7W9V083_9ACTN|nr:NUDIX domain-containing protein [Streptomyces zagrosensis]MBB5937875.1 8-oxo-dGTP pyrophosphatase MutT (NUDIX family) [Streptomyces zagrosensis]
MTERLATLESVAWLCVRDGRLLAVRTKGRDLFYLPGGKLEPGESGPQALARELAEELGVLADPGALVESCVIEDEAHAQGGRPLRMTCYTGPATGEARPGREIAELGWFGARAEHATRCAPAMRQVLTRLAADGLVTR